MADLVVADSDLKMMRESLCLAQVALTRGIENDAFYTSSSTFKRLSHLIAEIDRHRPIDVNGKHGNLHTATCGCVNVELPDDPINLDQSVPRVVMPRQKGLIRIIETGETFKNMKACADHIGGQTCNISDVLSGLRKTHKGYTFERVPLNEL